MSGADYTKYERETVITMNDAEKIANIYTAQRYLMARLLKIAEERPNDVKILRQTEDFLEIELPKRYVKIRPPRIVTEEEREIARQRFAQYKNNLINKTDEDTEEQDNSIIEDVEPSTDKPLF